MGQQSIRYKLWFIPFVFVFLWIPMHASIDSEAEKHKQSMLHAQPSVHGWCSLEKASIFWDLILEIKPSVCVEIGVYGGSSFFPIASALKYLNRGIVYAIDPWDTFECIRYYDPENLDPVSDEHERNYWVRLGIEQFHQYFLNVLSHYQLEKYSVVLRKTSKEAASLIGPIDFLHIDGNHTDIGAAIDVELYLPKVRPGGYICINDTLWPAMQAAVERLLIDCDPVQLINNGSAILFRKR